MELKDIIKDIKKRYNLTNAELAQKLNVSPNTVSRWLIGQVKSIQGETASALNELLGYDVQGVLQGNLVNLKKPILGMVKAGYDMFIDQDYLGEEIVSSDEYTSGDYFLRVSGDSMNQSGIVDGGLVYVKSTNIVNNGDIAVFCIDDEVTIKIYEKTKEGIKLIASNPNYETRFFSFKDAQIHNLKIIGKVIFSKVIF